MSKRSKRTGGGRGFGKQQMVLQAEELAGFAATIFALQLATHRLAELDPSKTAHDWQDFLMQEATEKLLQGEGIDLLDEMSDIEE